MDKILIAIFILILLIGFSTADKPEKPSVPINTVVRDPAEGTTRSHQFQQTWEEANKDIRTLGLPSGLVLPSGETVGEFIRSGESSGK